jgi:hypothetical protein
MRWITFTPAATANATIRQPVFDLSVGRSRDAPAAFLKGYKGHVHADGYAGHHPVYEGGATHVGCWVHARRYFFDARLSDPGRAHEALARIRALYAVEPDAKARGITGAALAAHRREHAVPNLAAFADWLAEQGLGRALQDRVGTEAEGVRDPEPLAHFVPGWHGEATIAAQVQNHVGGRAYGDQLEDGIGTQRVVVVLVLVARMPKILMRTMSVNECSMRSGSRGSSSTAANSFVKPMRSSNCRSGSRPASEVSGASENRHLR